MTRYTLPAISALAALGLAAGAANAQATITIVNNDGPGEGFNDTTPVAAVPGNSGTTLGQQRLNVFQAAADAWEGVISSPIEIRIDAGMDPLTPCTATSGVLGRAGTNQVFRDFTGAPQPNTWYPGALANAIAGADNGPGTEDIQARFNSNIDNNNACLNETNWFYGIGADAPDGTISFFDTVKHELGHGLGVQSFVDIVSTGQLLEGRNDVFSNMLHDHSSNTTWSSMTNAERLASAADTGDLHWIGARVNQCAQDILTAGQSGGHVQMYAPSPIQPGSSVSHFDTALTPDELMEPFATDTSDQRLTDRLLADIGWDVTSRRCAQILHLAAISTGGHNPRISDIVHSPRGSFAHHPALSPVHDLRGSIHQPAGSFHSVIASPGHNVFLSQPHNVLASRGHNSVASRFGGFDPSEPVINPFGQNMQMPGATHDQIRSLQHNQIVSSGHNVLVSQGHVPSISWGHDPWSSSGHNPFVSNWHNPIVSGHNPIISGHNPALSSHNPILSSHNPILSGHNPFLSQGPHNPFLSQGPHNQVLSNPTHGVLGSNVPWPEGPGFDPTQPGMGMGGQGMDGTGTGPQGLNGMGMPQAGPEAFGMDGTGQQPPAGPNAQQEDEGPQMERIPGNRAGTAYPGMPPGDPYFVPQQ